MDTKDDVDVAASQAMSRLDDVKSIAQDTDSAVGTTSEVDDAADNRTALPDPKPNPLFENIQNNWMIWMGGFCVALAGIFLAKYSIEKGLLGPGARIAMGVITGLSLHGAAEWLRRKTGESHPSFAALAGGGSISLFAILLAALHLYQMISPTTTFILLAIVAFATMVLAYWHGPILAAIGILGAYAVPAFVSDGSGAILFALGYALLITAAAQFLLRYVYRVWLWRGALVGALAWWLISLSYQNIAMEQGWYLAAVAYLLIAVPGLNWLLTQSFEIKEANPKTLLLGINGSEEVGSSAARELQLRYGLLLIVLAQGFTLLNVENLTTAVFAFTPLLLVLIFASRFRDSLTALPWVLVLVEIAAILIPRVSQEGERLFLAKFMAPEAGPLIQFCVATAVVIGIGGWMNYRESKFKGIWSSFFTLAPLMLLALVAFLTENVLSKWQWSALTAALAIAYLFFAGLAQRRNPSGQLLVWLIFAGHFSASLAAVMLTQEGRLTLAFALQIISLAWIIQYFKLPSLGWLLKLLVAIVVFRLTLNPWLVDYGSDSHWTLLTYGGSALCTVIAVRLLRAMPNLSKWAEGAALHLFVLFLWSELRYWLNDGNVFSQSSSLLEVSLTMLLFGSVSIVYYRRSLVSENLQKLYGVFASILLGLALACYWIIVIRTLIQDPWVWEHISEAPIFNGLLLSFGSPILLALATWRFHNPTLKKMALIAAGIAGFIFVNLQIRHLWQGDIRLYQSMQSAELYTYSVVWLLIAVVAILGGARVDSSAIYKAGMGLLGLVIAKLFLVDMSDLDGLLRVASFMGLGLSLLGISYLHQKMQTRMNTGNDEGSIADSS